MIAPIVFISGSMPTDYELYYGFTRFAVELNELCPEMKDLLPPTDARFRPDQRCVSVLQCPPPHSNTPPSSEHTVVEQSLLTAPNCCFSPCAFIKKKKKQRLAISSDEERGGVV